MASKRNKGGRPGHKPTPALRRMVAGLAAAGTGQEAIATALGITRPTLVAHYRREIDQGGADLIANAMRALGYLLKRNSFPAVQLVLKCKGGWSERIGIAGTLPDQGDKSFILEIVADDGRPITPAALPGDDLVLSCPIIPMRH